jgi:fatty-acyl-CoA synthase
LVSAIFDFLYKTSDKVAQSVVYTAFWLLRRVLNIGSMVGAEATVSVGFILDCFMGPILLGSPTALLTGRHFDPIQMYKLIEKYKLGFLLLSGDTMLNILADAAEPGEYDTSSVKIAASTSMPTSPYTRKRFAERFPNAMYVDSFSSTEVIVGSLSIYTHDMCMREVPTRFRMPSYAKLFDENHNPVPLGEPGMYYQSVGSLSVGYYKEPEKYAKISFTDADGVRWTSMGDYGVLDKDGFFTVVGRGSGVINTGGLKVWCEECEGVLIGHPKVADVAYTGVPDEKWGEAVTALVQLKEGEKATEEELIDWCKDTMAGYKVPKHVIFGDVPYVDLAKKRRRAIKEIVMEKLGIE